MKKKGVSKNRQNPKMDGFLKWKTPNWNGWYFGGYPFFFLEQPIYCIFRIFKASFDMM